MHIPVKLQILIVLYITTLYAYNEAGPFVNCCYSQQAINILCDHKLALYIPIHNYYSGY